ncbi:beta-ketoacyl synthase chain length factor [Agarivorans aestuarii]|uniref:beta-ketoacyl synthase chain length factor n=1 Tax=Agarivorans aestuarii TaxID=1563703 RepID=UPI001C7E5813|nr:beta-ketoacyl synthase chain length factor [Agarivorans aestuarii]
MDAVFKIENWTSWNSTINDGVAATPQLPEIPPMQRRRFSFLSKMALRVILDILPNPRAIRSVFSSRHGELHRTLDLLLELTQGSPLSPAKFSQSVYNTSSGLYSINQKNTAPSTVVTSGRNSLAMAFVEAISQSICYQEKVLLVYVDEPLPEIYKAYADEQEELAAFACILSAAEFGWHAKLIADDNSSLKSPRHLASQLIAALSKSEDYFELELEAQKWIWDLKDE